MPDQFGLVAMLSVFTNIASTFIDSGFSTAIIRKNDRTQTDCSTVYWFNIIVSLFFYAILFLVAPWISDFYDIKELTSILRISSLGLIIGSFGGVQRSLLEADMRFKELTKFNLMALVISGGLGIFLAYHDFKVWALVFQGLCMTTINTIVVINKVKWRPSLIFSKASFKEFFGFGSKLLASSLLNNVFSSAYTIAIGKIYKASDLAFYNRALSLTSLTSSLPTGILQSITFPALCKLQNNDEVLKQAFRKIIRICSFVIFPLCLGVGAVAFPLINSLYTETWIFSATLLSILVFGHIWLPINSINANFLLVKGRSDLALKLSIYEKLLSLIVLLSTLPFGLVILCWGGVIVNFLNLLWYTYYTGKFINLTIWRQLKDILHIFILGIIMFFGARVTAIYMGNDLVSLICSIGVGAIIYIGGALLFKYPEVSELKNILK